MLFQICKTILFNHGSFFLRLNSKILIQIKMYISLLLFLFVILNKQANGLDKSRHCTCKYFRNPSDRIIGGDKMKAFNIPWSVYKNAMFLF